MPKSSDQVAKIPVVTLLGCLSVGSETNPLRSAFAENPWAAFSRFGCRLYLMRHPLGNCGDCAVPTGGSRQRHPYFRKAGMVVDIQAATCLAGLTTLTFSFPQRDKLTARGSVIGSMTRIVLATASVHARIATLPGSFPMADAGDAITESA